MKWRDECFELVYVKATNADKIRNMPDEELAEFLDIVGEDGISSQYADVPCDCCCEKQNALNVGKIGFNQKQNRREYGQIFIQS